MYDRALRPGLEYKFATGPNVGPNTYYPDMRRPCDTDVNMIPFLSSDKRFRPIVSDLPPPNIYNPKLPDRIIGGSSLGNKEQRFKEIEDDKVDIDNEVDKRGVFEGIGFMYKCRVPFTLIGSSPSIPPKRHKGYNFIDCKLTPVKPSEHDLHPGPLAYKVARFPEEEPYFKGCHWSRSKTKRFICEENGLPGPGTYTLEPPVNWARYEADLVRDQIRKGIESVRYLDRLLMRLKKENLPGPADYDLNPQVKKGPFGFRKAPKNVQNFLTTAKRFKPNRSDGPGPVYMDPRTALDALKRPTCNPRRSCFLVSSCRFRGIRKDTSPGPNQYDTRKPLCCKRSFAPTTSPFNTSAPRDKGQVPADVCSTPSPDAYFAKKPYNIKNNVAASFNSTALRGERHCEEYQANCASYDITCAYKKLTGHCSHRKTKKFHFNTTCKRFGRITDFKMKSVDRSTPGPGKLNIANYKPGRQCNVGKIPRCGRKPHSMGKSPGPADYTIHPIYASTCLKPTFNRTLGNPIPRYVEPGEWENKTRPFKILRPYVCQKLEDMEEQRIYEKQVLAVAKLLNEEVDWHPQFPRSCQKGEVEVKKCRPRQEK